MAGKPSKPRQVPKKKEARPKWHTEGNSSPLGINQSTKPQSICKYNKCNTSSNLRLEFWGIPGKDTFKLLYNCDIFGLNGREV